MVIERPEPAAGAILLASGVNVKVVSEMLGHSSVSITLSIYAHVLPHMQQSAVQAMDTLLGSPELRKIVDELG